MQLARGMPLGRPFGVLLSAHTSWFPAAALLAAYLMATSFGSYELALAVALAAATVIGAFASVVLHELAHVSFARSSGMGLAGVMLYPTGGIPRLSGEPGRRPAHLAYALVGPLASLVLAGACWGVSSAVPAPATDVLETLAVLNVGLAALNLLPAYPLDAWRVLAAPRWSVYRSTVVAAQAGRVLGTLLVLVGAGLAALRWPSVRAADGLLVALLGLFVLVPAETARRGARVAEALQGRTVGEWAQPFAGRVSLDGRPPGGRGPFAVAEAGRLAGVLVDGDGRRPVSDAMIPWRSNLSCLVDDPLPATLERMASAGAGLLVVLDAEGVVRGVLSEDEVVRKLSARSR